jgi:abequosyltransferase
MKPSGEPPFGTAGTANVDAVANNIDGHDLAAIKPLLTIAIPTWNRSTYLAMTLEQLRRELDTIGTNTVEVLVSDNCSTDDTPQVVQRYASTARQFRSVRNAEDIGSDNNLAQCFNLAKGKYVLILGDDDLLCDGTLASLCAHLQASKYGIVCLRAYGYDRDSRQEHPGGRGKLREFTDSGEFLAAIGRYMTLISSCVINKSLLQNIDAREYCGGNLVQVHLVLRAALLSRHNLFVDDYQVACKRNNSGGYDFSRVFVEEFGRALDGGTRLGLSNNAVRHIETRMLVGFYPAFLVRQRRHRSGNLAIARARFDSRFGRRILYWVWVAPILLLPRPFAISWGLMAVLFGRIASGESRRSIVFASNRIKAALFSQDEAVSSKALS